MQFSPAELEQIVHLALAALRSQGAAAPAAVQQLAALVPSQAAEAAPAVPVPVSGTLSDWLPTYEAILAERTYKPQTSRNRRTALAHVRRLWGDRVLVQLRPHEIASAIKREFMPDHSSTARRVLAELRDVYTEAIANGVAEQNPAMHCKLPVHKVARHRLRIETFLEMLVLAQASRQTWVFAMLLLAIVTGQRRADLAKMRFDDVVSDADGVQVLQIEQQKEAGKGYGARVSIPLSLRLDVIGLTVGEVIEICRELGGSGETLLRKANGRPIELSSLSTRFAECIAAVMGDEDPGAHVRPSLHEVRSLSARMYLAQGMPREAVQTLLGHKNAEMTDVYADDRGQSAHVYKRVPLAVAA